MRWLGAGATAVYATPLALSVLTYAMHDFYHLREHFGYVSEAELERPADPGEFEHAHGGGARHHHDSATDALLAAAQRTDEPADEHQTPSLELTGHLPARMAAVLMVVSVGAEPAVELADVVLVAPSPPPLPPPRA